MSLTVSPLSPHEAPHFTAFLAEADAPIYPTLPWRDFLKAVTGGEAVWLLARRAGQIVGVFPYLVAQGPAGPVVNSLPWYGSLGGVLLAPGEAATVREALLLGFLKHYQALRPLSATLILPPEACAHLETYRALLPIQAEDARVTQETALPKTPDALWPLFHQKTRNQVRKGQKGGFAVTVQDDDQAWDFLAKTHAQNLAAIGGKAKPYAHFQALRRCLPPSLRRLYLAHDQAGPQAALLTVHHGRTVEYLTPVITHEARPRQPLSALILRAMEDAIALGQDRFAWGGTWASQQSLHHFKAGFGAQDRPYRYLTLASDPAALTPDLLAHYPYWFLYPFR